MKGEVGDRGHKDGEAEESAKRIHPTNQLVEGPHDQCGNGGHS